MKAETIILNADRNVTLTTYIQEVNGEFSFSKRPAVLILPGGGYAMCSDREADPVALAYLKAGFQAFILRYTLKSQGGWPLPLKDYEQAMRLIQDNAEQWHVSEDKIAVVGFSAGGHLAACAATLSDNKPTAAILVYPAILKNICDLCQPGLPYPYEHVTHKTAPCFLVATRNDRVTKVENTLAMSIALEKKQIPFESHIYSYGAHGFSTAEDWVVTSSVSSRVANWVEDSIDWLGEVMGEFTTNGLTEPNPAIQLNADLAPFLSVECSLNHINEQDENTKELLAPMYQAIEKICEERGLLLEDFMHAMGTATVREIMETIQTPKQIINSIDSEFHSILNKINE